MLFLFASSSRKPCLVYLLFRVGTSPLGFTDITVDTWQPRGCARWYPQDVLTVPCPGGYLLVWLVCL